MDFTGDAAMARFGFVLGWEAASQTKLIGWQKGDEFEAARMKALRVGINNTGSVCHHLEIRAEH